MGDVVNLRFVQIRRDFDRQRYIFAMRGRQLRLFVFQGFQQCAQLVAALQGAQVFRIGGGNVDRDVARVGVGFFQANQIIVGRVFNRRNGIFTDVDAQNAFKAAVFNVADHRVNAVVVETHAVDDALVFGNAEKARLRIARLRLGRDRADFDKAETQSGKRIDTLAVFVQTCRQTDRIGQLQAHQLGWSGVAVHFGQQAEFFDRTQTVEREMMGLFCIEAKQDGTDE